MDVLIRALQDDDIPCLVQWSLLSFDPIFASFERILGPETYPENLSGLEKEPGGGRRIGVQERHDGRVGGRDGAGEP